MQLLGDPLSWKTWRYDLHSCILEGQTFVLNTNQKYYVQQMSGSLLTPKKRIKKIVSLDKILKSSSLYERVSTFFFNKI